MRSVRVLLLALLVPLTACKKDPAPSAGSGSAAAPPAGLAAPAPSGSGAATPAPAAAADELTFARRVHKVGDKAKKTETMGMTMTIGAAPEMKMDKLEEEAREIVEAAGETYSKIKVTYVARRQTQAMNGKTKERSSPLVGKTYIVWRKDDKLEATREDGSAVPADELTELLDENKRLGKPDAMDDIVTSKTWKRGQKVTFTADELATLNQRNESGGPEEQRFEALALTLTGVENGVALMTMDMTVHVKNPKGTLQMMLSGPVRVEVASGRILEASGTGQVQGDLGGAVAGTVEMKTLYAY